MAEPKKHGSLFSGIAGWSIAADAFGYETVFNCEINPFCQKILRYYYPKAILYEDIKKTDFKRWAGQIYILTNSFPCQPFSVAGKRKGTDDSRYLWDESLRAICEVQPEWAVSENVPGLINWNKGMVFDKVQSDLEAAGYEVIPFVLPAASVGAPHKRDRIWFIAHRTDTGTKTVRSGRKDSVLSCNNVTNAGLFGPKIKEEQTTGIEQCSERDASDTKSGESGQPEIGNGREGIERRSEKTFRAFTNSESNRNQRDSGTMGNKEKKSKSKNDGNELNGCSQINDANSEN
jgi:DNA-cytosine methyltransferase